jgi:uridine kinase
MYIVGIAGGSGSGKTTFAKKILTKVGNPKLSVLNQDHYYHKQPPERLKVHGESNFDHPDAFDWELLKAHLHEIKAGKTVGVPRYDFATSQRTEETDFLEPSNVLIVEGIFSLWDSEIRALMDLKVFLHVEADVRFIRRLHRDVRERKRTLDSIIRQYYETVRPMHHEFLEPTRQYADLIVGDETDIAADVLAARIRELLQ